MKEGGKGERGVGEGGRSKRGEEKKGGSEFPVHRLLHSSFHAGMWNIFFV